MLIFQCFTFSFSFHTLFLCIIYDTLMRVYKTPLANYYLTDYLLVNYYSSYYMAKRRRKRRKKSTAVVLNKYKLGSFFVVLGGLYFFAYFLASESPLIQFFERGAFAIFGELGTGPFFALSIVVWLMFMVQWHMIKTLAKQFILMLVFVSAFLNFQIIDGGSSAYEAFGWYISRPLIWMLEQIFWPQPVAIKVFVVLLFAWLIARILYSFNVSMPRLNLQLQQDSRPARSPKRTSVSMWSSRTSNELEKKVKASLGRESSSDKNRLIDAKALVSWQKSAASWPKSALKDMIKKKLTKQVDDKVHEKTMAKISFPADKPSFPTSIMDSSLGQEHHINESFLVEQAKSLQNKLMEFNVPVEIQGFDIWPSVVQVKVRPEAGIKVSSIENLKNDIALSMKAKWLRIVAPIPGTDTVGIQIPNPKPTMVHLGDVLKSQDFVKAMQDNLTNIALGKAIDGSDVIVPLEKMPHLLVAGATGTGKSVGVNDMILSLMYQNSPSELKFLMIDPKQVELEFYSWLPYLLAPIVTAPDQALKLLQRSVEEMESRYSKLKKIKAKNLDEYNKKSAEDPLYRIVIVIDELADLMMSGNKKDVETCITRIAQKARAVGMHLIIATQRPSVNVLTGLIKANIPTRVSFAVVSQIDSRTILWMKWAEDLVGRGDLLYMDTNTKFPRRIQAPFVSSDETEKIMESLKAKYMSNLTEEDIYHPEIVRMLEWRVDTSKNMRSGWGWGDDEELIEQAIEIIADTRKASATMLQRKLNVGFARAARIMDSLEERGIVWPQEWAKPREVLI